MVPPPPARILSARSLCRTRKLVKAIPGWKDMLGDKPQGATTDTGSQSFATIDTDDARPATIHVSLRYLDAHEIVFGRAHGSPMDLDCITVQKLQYSESTTAILFHPLYPHLPRSLIRHVVFEALQRTFGVRRRVVEIQIPVPRTRIFRRDGTEVTFEELLDQVELMLANLDVAPMVAVGPIGGDDVQDSGGRTPREVVAF
ncbi:hypothetical protein GGR56DRAFT_672841 [Xylariaceae sp. FL0804]|nr:hypothetical protein GGR56DRAFT_672841 [Xylariaceae sp. FL0804]